MTVSFLPGRLLDVGAYLIFLKIKECNYFLHAGLWSKPVEKIRNNKKKLNNAKQLSSNQPTLSNNTKF